MTKLLKFLFVIFGGIFIGFGIGIIFASNLVLSRFNFWLAISFSLILGGFFFGLGFIKKIPKKEEKPFTPEEPGPPPVKE